MHSPVLLCWWISPCNSTWPIVVPFHTTEKINCFDFACEPVFCFLCVSLTHREKKKKKSLMVTVVYSLFSAGSCRPETDGKSSVLNQNEKPALNFNYSMWCWKNGLSLLRSASTIIQLHWCNGSHQSKMWDSWRGQNLPSSLTKVMKLCCKRDENDH